MTKQKTNNPVAQEAAKTSEQRADDIAYTIDHSIACLVSDFVTNPIIGWATQKWLGKRFGIGGCGHDHSKEHHHDHGHSHGIFGHTVLGEIIGDSAAVPVTIAFQRYAPGFMNGVRHVMEPWLSPLFHNGAKRSARLWAKDNGIAEDSMGCQKKEAEIYEREMSHLPQALMWTVSSMAINIASQKMSGNKNPVWQIAAGCAGGITATAAIVVGSRALMPETVHRWDRFTGEKIVQPITGAVKKAFGVAEKNGNDWAERVNDSQVPKAPSL